MDGFRLARVKCPRCGGEVLVSVGPRVVEEAKASPTGLAVVAVPHGDHALLIHFDANGHERGVRVAILAQVPVHEGGGR